MKRLLLLLALCLIVGIVSATPLTFQNEHDITDVTVTNPGSCTIPANNGFVRSATAGNQYVGITTSDFCAIQNINANPFTYAAWTTTLSGYNDIVELGDATNTTMSSLVIPNGVGRYEVVVSGSIATVYKNGIVQATSSALTTNPSFIRLHDGYGSSGSVSLDDFIMNTAEGTHVIGMPASNGYYIKKDMVNPAASGLYNWSTGALVNSNYMNTTWGRSNVSSVGGSDVNESMYLQNVDTGITYETQYTGNASAGTTTWNIASSLIAASAPYGLYRVRFSTFDSDYIAYIADGAEITFDKEDYNQNDVATMTYLIESDYWDTSTYTYSIKIYRANDWVVVHNQGLTERTGTDSYQFTSSDTQGTYYAVIVASPTAGGNDIWMVFDYAQITAYFSLYGYVNDAETELPISGANVSVVQDSIISNAITIADGNYTVTGFLSGSPLSINTTATGYSQYYITLTPGTSGSKYVNITLNSTTPMYTGLGIGGVARTGIFTGGVVTSGYGQPISGATVMLINTTNGESYSKTTNMAGWYLCDEGTSCFLTTGRPYDVWGEKLGYSNSPNYTAVAA